MAGDVIQVAGAMLNGFAVVDSTAKGGVTDIGITQAGLNYQVGDLIRARTEDDGFGFTAKVTEVDNEGQILGTKVTNPGYNYQSAPVLYTDRGSSAQLIAKSKVIGAIQGIKMENPFVDFDDAVVTINSETGAGAVLQARQVSRWETRDWVDRKGFLDENSTLIDSDKVQQFSYEIVSPISSKQYEAFVNEYLHPMGYIKTSSYEIISHLGLNITAEDSVIGGEEAILFENILALNFISTHHIDQTVVVLGTSLGEEIITNMNEPILID